MAPSLKKVDLPPEMCEFFDLPEGSKLNPGEIAIKFLQYIAKNSLKEKGKIFVDEKLRKLLKGESPEYITPKEFQKVMMKLYDPKGENKSIAESTAELETVS